MNLQPLRIPQNWTIHINLFFECDPTEENCRAGWFGSSFPLFSASNERLRLSISIDWQPEDDPAGEYELLVWVAPWPRTEEGRRRKGLPLEFNETPVHTFTTKSRLDIVRELELVLQGRDEWFEHN